MEAPELRAVPGRHVFVVAGDVTNVVCDAWLLPTDDAFNVTASFGRAVGLDGKGRLSGLEWEDSRVLHFPRPGAGPQIWLGNLGRAKSDPEWYAACVEPFVRGACAQLPDRPGGLAPLLALPVLGSGEGGSRHDRGGVHRVLLPALYRAVEQHHADVALVCFEREAYSAAQRVRQRMLEGCDQMAFWDLGDRTAALAGHARRLADAARQGDLVLFLGVGVSAGAGLPAWQALLDEVAAEVGVNGAQRKRLQNLDLRDQAAVLARRLAGNPEASTIQQAVGRRLESTRYALAHGLLASLPSKEAVTTNYDQLFEAAVKPVDKEMAVLPYKPVATGRRWLLKLHGSIDQDESIVLTRADYLGIPARHGALFGLVQAMLMTRHMLFVGYSLSDDDFHQLIHEVRAARSDGPQRAALGTVLTLFDDEFFTELWTDDVNVVALADQPSEPPTEAEVAVAARRLHVFLDLVGYLSADLDRFLLDPAYRGLLNDDEQELADRLAGLVALEGNLPAGQRLRRFLGELGASEP